MWKYLVRRIIWFIPSLFLLAVAAFYLSRATPDDPVERMLGLEGLEEISVLDPEQRRLEYQRISRRMGRDKPLFYWSVVPHNYPPNLQEYTTLEKRKFSAWLKAGYQWTSIRNFTNELDQLEEIYLNNRDALSFKTKNRFDQSFQLLHRTYILKQIPAQFNGLKELLLNSGWKDQTFPGQVSRTEAAYSEILESKYPILYPRLYWHGTDNQFHHWFANLLKGDFGISLSDGRPATSRIAEALNWTLFMVVIALLLSLLLSIPAAVLASRFENSWPDFLISNISYLLYAIPLFWLATLLVTFCTTDEYAGWLNIFPAVGSNYLGYAKGFWPKFGQFGKVLILPVFCLVLHSLAYLIKQIKVGMSGESRKFYILTARAKGLNEWKIYIKHIFPNAIIPIITLIIDAFPAALAGSIIIEVIFNIPGMGRLMYNAIFSADWNVVYGILIVLGFITVVSYLIGDLLYSYFNPKIRFHKD